MKIRNTIIPLFMILLFSIASLMCGCTAQRVIHLNKYVSITYDGKNGGGTANYVFDFDNFEKDYAGKIKLTDNAKVTGINDLEKSVARLLIDTCVSVTVDSDEEYLSNGDTVKLSWNCNESSALDYFNCKLAYEDIETQVSGLKEPEAINPFDYFHLSTTFYSPFLEAALEPSGEDPMAYSICFSFDKRDNLKTGETIKATASYAEGEKKFIHDFGCKFNQTEKEYTIDSTARFVSNIKDVQTKFKPTSWTDFYWEGWRKRYIDYTIECERVECYISTNDALSKTPKKISGPYKDVGSHSILAIYNHYIGVGVSDGNEGEKREYWSVNFLCNYYIDENGTYGFFAEDSYNPGWAGFDKYASLEEAKTYVADYFKNTDYILHEQSH